MTLEQFIRSFPLFVVGIAAATTLLSFRYRYPLHLKRLSLFWVLIFLIDFAGHMMSRMNLNNHWLYNIYFLLFYLVLPYLYFHQILSKTVRGVIKFYYATFPLFVAVNLYLSGIRELQTVFIVVGGSFIIFLAVAYFRQLYISDKNDKITRDPWFWFSFGFIIHFGGTLPFLGMMNYLWQQYPGFTRFYYLYFANSFTILLNVLVITGFLCRTNYRRSP